MNTLVKRFAFCAVLCASLNSPAFAEEPLPPVEDGYKHFEVWLDEFKNEAIAAGIRSDVLDDAFAEVDEPLEDIIEKDRNQPEVKITFSQYVRGVLTDKKVAAARQVWAKNKALLRQMENTYDVQPQVLLALWGIESSFGKMQGKYTIVDSLATLAYDGRRSQFFRGQLLDALRILQQENMKSRDLIGSWAGAMGQVQFMPSSFLKYATDFNGDGKKDIWKNNADALASMANYLHDKGWDDNLGWGVAVSLPEDSKMDWRTMKERLPLSMWKKFGVRQKNDEMLRGVKEEARLVLLDDDLQKAYLVYNNYDIIMDWNRSTYFATTVFMFADAIGDEP